MPGARTQGGETDAHGAHEAAAPFDDSQLDGSQLDPDRLDPDRLDPDRLDAGRLDARVEALLLTVDKPLSAAKLASAVGPRDGSAAPGAGEIEAAVARLNGVYERTGRAFRVEPVAGGYRVMARPEHASVLAAFHRGQADGKLSRPAIETLAIVAYRQPITRGSLEAIRGVACGEVLRGLLERRLVTVTGRAEEPGRPMLYGTTKTFLDAFGLASIKDLPPEESFAAGVGSQPMGQPTDQPTDQQTGQPEGQQASQPEGRPEGRPNDDR